MTKGKRRARKVQVRGLGFDSQIEAPRWETVRTVDLLVLDDFGAQSDTAWAQEKLYQLVNYRVNHTAPPRSPAMADSAAQAELSLALHSGRHACRHPGDCRAICHRCSPPARRRDHRRHGRHALCLPR